MTKKRVYKIIMILIIILYLLPINVFANTLVLRVLTDKDSYSLQEKVTVTIDWKDKMQAASYTIEYDSDKLTFSSANIASNFYNIETKGKIKINWASMEEIDFTKMTFEFKAVKEGNATINISNVEAFADGNLVNPQSYDNTTYGSKIISIKSNEQPSNSNNQNNQNGTNNSQKKDNITIGANNSNNGIKNKDVTSAQGKLPYTGIDKTILIGIGLLLISATIGFKKYKNLSEI